MKKSNGFKLLSRDDFRNQVFERDNHKCVVCGKPGQDAHHIIERRLFITGGYYKENGATVCGDCHILCEQTVISVEEIREYAGITRVCVPDEMYPDHRYDKWGNHILGNGQRTRGPLFFDESVQKILKQGGVLDLFTNRVKYPRTFHLPWSPGIHDDDRVIPSMASFEGEEVIVTEKMDGENTTCYNDWIHARAVDGRSHPSQDRAKALWAEFAHDIPQDWRVNCENVYAKHSVAYDSLRSFLLGFAVWNERNVCLSWDETMEWFELLGITPVPVLYRGIYDEKVIRSLYDENKDWERSEGLVLRVARSFDFGEFHKCVAKYVRSDHVQTNKHWKFGQRIEPNKLKSPA